MACRDHRSTWYTRWYLKIFASVFVVVFGEESEKAHRAVANASGSDWIRRGESVQLRLLYLRTRIVIVYSQLYAGVTGDLYPFDLYR